MWPTVDGLRTLELGSPGALRARLTALVLAGRKRATAGLLDVDYRDEGEALEQPGEILVLVDDDGGEVGRVQVEAVVVRRFADVPWEFAAAEGEGAASVEDWRASHRRFWAGEGTPVDDDTEVVCVSFRLAADPG